MKKLCPRRDTDSDFILRRNASSQFDDCIVRGSIFNNYVSFDLLIITRFSSSQPIGIARQYESRVHFFNV